MIDYSKMSDFEINSAVHNALMREPYKIEFLGNDRIRWVRGSTDVTTGKIAYSKNSLKDYCNNPADAWPIIEQNKITIMFEDDQWTAFGGMSIHHSREADWDFCEYDKKPLRAAMIVFLMMQEKTNGD